MLTIIQQRSILTEVNLIQQKGGQSMTNTERLKELISKSGIKLEAIMNAAGIKSYATLRGKINNDTEFTASEISASRVPLFRIFSTMK